MSKKSFKKGDQSNSNFTIVLSYKRPKRIRVQSRMVSATWRGQTGELFRDNLSVVVNYGLLRDARMTALF